MNLSFFLTRPFTFLLLSLAVMGCGERPLQWQLENGYRWASVKAYHRGNGLIGLSPDVTEIWFRNEVSDKLIASNRVLLNGAGVATGDIDGDGFTDIYFCKTDGPNILYRNLGGWKFETLQRRPALHVPISFPQEQCLRISMEMVIWISW